MKFRLREIPIIKQNRIKRFVFKDSVRNRNFIGVDTETTRELGQEALSLQIAVYKGNKNFETLFIKNEDDPTYELQDKFRIQGYDIYNTTIKEPVRYWRDVLNRFLMHDNNTTLSFFNILFDIPLIYPLRPHRHRKGLWAFNTALVGDDEKKYQTVSLAKLREMKTLIDQKHYQFLDVQTLSNVLYGEYSLAGASNKILGLKKLHDPNFGIKYSIWDACLTALLAEKLNKELYDLIEIRADTVRTAGTFSKYLLGSMGFRRPKFSNREIGPFWKSYIGARVETNPETTKKALQGNFIYADIKGQYAQAMANINVFKYMACKQIEIEQIPVKESLFIPKASNAVIAAKIYAENAPLYIKTTEGNIFAEYTGTGYFMLPDLWSANLLGHENTHIEILKAWKPKPIGLQKLEPKYGLRPHKLAHDLIRLRASSKEHHRNLFYKQVLNTIYGITTEGREKTTSSGVYTNPVVSAAITSLARYWLALGEWFVNNNGGRVYYMATDSFFIDENQFNPLKAFLSKHGVNLGLKGRGEGLLTIAASKYALYKDRNGFQIAKDENNKDLATRHGLNMSYQLPGNRRFNALLLKNYKEAFQCYLNEENPLNHDGFHGLHEIMVTSHSIETPAHLLKIRRAFKEMDIPQKPRCGMFYYSFYEPIGDLDQATKHIVPTKELAFDLGEKLNARTLEGTFRRHFSHDDQKFDYKNKKRWKINEKDQKPIKRRYIIEREPED